MPLSRVRFRVARVQARGHGLRLQRTLLTAAYPHMSWGGTGRPTISPVLLDTQLMFSLGDMGTGSWLQRGKITEIVGPLGSGRTSLLVRLLREVTMGGAAALVDADATFDPVTAARAGVALERLLWVRCAGRRDVAVAALDLLARCPGFALVALDAGE